ncbi:MAG TPA: copper transporter [Armatimonadota bacterium]|nr:copper transporter [Armatimonadota bacterium]
MPIDYRYHIGSFVAIFVALLLGILIGIGLAPNPEEFESRVAMLKEEYRQTRQAKTAELKSLEEANREYDMLTRETVAAVVNNRLAGKRVAVVLNHDFGRNPLPENLRAVLKQAGAAVTSTTIVTRDFVTLPTPVKQKVAQRLSLYPPPGVHFRTLIAQALAKDLARGRAELILDLHAGGLLASTADSDYTLRPDAVLMVGGMSAPSDAAPERIDLPMIQELAAAHLRVVGCEPREAPISAIPTYKAAGVPTVDNADTPAGRLAVVLSLAGADGHYGIKETADSFLPPISPTVAH